MSKKKNIGEWLLEYETITQNDLQEGLKIQKETGLRLGEALVKLGKVSMEDIEWVLSKQLEIPFVIVEDIQLDPELAGKFEKEFLISNRVLPVYETDEHVSIVTDDPLNHAAIEFIEESLGKEVNLSAGTGEKIDKRLRSFFKKDAMPGLTASIENIIARIEDTSFYRVDFLLYEHFCEVSIFGFGILKQVMTINDVFKQEDLFKSFNSLNIPFLYDQFANEKRTLFSVYPLVRPLVDRDLPAIIGCYGLYLPTGVAFADSNVHGISHVFSSNQPMPGYPFLSTKWNKPHTGQMIYTVDTAPEHFEQYYVTLHIPRKCGACRGKGCKECKDLGYAFNAVEGIYSSSDFNTLVREE